MRILAVIVVVLVFTPAAYAWSDDNFFNPSGNIQCTYTADGSPPWLACQTRSNHRVVWLETGSSASTFTDRQGHFGLKAKPDGGWWRMGHVLDYGQTWRSHQFQCRSEYGGMRCWTSAGSHGFFLNAWELQRF